MQVQHLNVGARAGLLLAETAAERWALLRRVGTGFGAGLLAFCILATHLHLVVAGAAADAIATLEAALAAYVRETKRGAGGGRPLLRGPVDAREKTDPYQLLRAIRYVHENALGVASVAQSVEWPFSSERAFVGLRVASAANVEIAGEMLGPRYAGYVKGPPIELTDLESPPCPVLAPGLLAAAAADVYEMTTRDMMGTGRGERASRARALYLRLGKLEGYRRGQLVALLGRSASRASRIVKNVEIPDREVRIARTIAREPSFARHLQPVECQTARIVAPEGGSLDEGGPEATEWCI